MSETITQSSIEDAVSSTNSFLSAERGVSIDGGWAGAQVAERIQSVGETAEDLLTSTKIHELNGLYVSLGRMQLQDKTYVGGNYDQAVTALPGHIVLVPSALVEQGASYLYPAVVSEDGIKDASLRLHVLRQPYRQQLRYAASVVLSAAGQSETKGVGSHGRMASDGVEAEHFATLLAAGSDPRVQASWKSGRHINHEWRTQSGNSVTSEVSKRLFGQDIPQSTITITRQQIESGKALLFWHEGMRDEQTGKPETATRDKALVVIQGLGFEALRSQNPRGIDAIKGMIA